MPSVDQEATARSRSHWDEMYAKQATHTWHTNPIVSVEIARRIGGASKHWLYWLFQDHLSFRPETLLSVGCGDGSHELIIARNQFATHVDAFDASEVGIGNARSIATREQLNANFYVDTFDNFIAEPVRKTYDAVMFVGSLHHVLDLEGMLNKVKNSLNRHGILIFNEYVGPCYIILPDYQVSLVNKMLDALSPEFKIAPDVQWVNPRIETARFLDPSEAVRSALIPQFLRLYFDVKWVANFGGSLLHPIFQLLNVDRLSDGSSESNTVVKLLIAIENILMQAGVLDGDFSLGICQLPEQPVTKIGDESGIA
jgi:SAM-dependent methyltransferase